MLMISRKWETMKWIELPNQEYIWSLEEKENYKYLGILEVDIIKQVDMKEKYEKNSPEERESLLNSSAAAEISVNE